ncbi:NAD-binding protein [Nocardioides sp. TRM66260-LWL]|uniref:potassium channel protein n=1 Tax=Nocardioides sp. TRM66260-LWL TaxID=2874478 RepID=UPI001CC4B0B9|nr:potassium channel protein [Nocardioides sp. TRM66260-LWL]MBZ5734684.1 NAD-binding protein [Nocardioides sp. TRM66260-LWL]
MDGGQQQRVPLVLVCGLHDEGLRVVEQLHAAGVAVVVVDDVPEPRLVPALERLGVRWVAADSRLPETLLDAGLAAAAALVCVESDDLHTLATALLARQLRPELRVVVQLRNEAVGRALEATGVAVLDVARLSAPSIVRACLGTERWSLELAGTAFEMVAVTAREAGPLRALYGDLAPIAVVPAGGGSAVVTPGRDEPVSPGDVVHLLGTPTELAAADLAPTRERALVGGARAGRPHRTGRDPWLRPLLSTLDRRVKRALLALATLATISVTVLMTGYQEPDGTRMSLLDALYFTVETIGTVGYGDFYFRDQHPWLRGWAIVLMVVGATLATVFFALLTNALIARRIEETLGLRRITGLADHVVVVGTGSIGMAVVRLLRAAGRDVVVVERDPANRFRAELDAARVPVVTADATLPDTWRQLRLEHARGVAVLISDDLVGIETGLAVRDLLTAGERWERTPVVLRVFGRRLATTVEQSFGFRHVRSPAALAAPWFVGAALGLEVVDTFYVGDQPLLLARLVVRGGLDGVALADLPARVRIVVLERDHGVEHPPRRDTRLRVGDVAYLVGPYEELIALLRADGLASS